MEGEKLKLVPGIIKDHLSGMKMSDDGESFLFTELIMPNKGIEALNKCVEEGKEVYIVNFANNGIADPTFLSCMANLVHLDLSKNKVKNLSIFSTEEFCLNLKYLDISSNKFTELPALKCPKLQYLDISYNKLEKVNEGWAGHGELKIFKSIDNKFKNMTPFKNMPKLLELYLANNQIGALSGYEGLGALKKLHLRHNKIAKIEEELPELPSLKYLNLRTNALPTMEDAYRLLTGYPELDDINLINCPCELAFSSMNLMVGKMLSKKTALKRFCKVDITDQHRLEAVYLAKYEWTKAEEEAKRLAEEEAAKAAAEEAG